MAEPAQKYDDDYSEEPIVRPDLHVLEGGGETSPRKKGHLKAAPSPEELQASEAAPQSTTSTVDSKEGRLLGLAGDQVGKGFTDTDPSAKGLSLRAQFTRRRMIGGGAIGLLIAAIFGTFTIASGPLQFIHMAQLLKNFHFASQEDAGDDRMLKIARFIKYKGDQRTHLNSLGNKYADKIEARFNETGIESSYSKAGYGDGYIIDTNKIPADSAFAGARGKTSEEAKAFFKSAYNVDVSIGSDGKLFASSEDMGYFKNKKLIKVMLEGAGFSKVAGPLRTRIMGKRAGIDWHPMKKLDRQILETTVKRFEAWQKSQEDAINNGVDETKPTTAIEEEKKPDAAKTQNAKEAQAATDATISEADGAAQDLANGNPSSGGAFEAFKTSTGLKLAGGATAAIGIACLVNGIAAKLPQLKQANVVLPLMRMGMESIAVGNQIMTGQDVDTEQMGFFAKQLYSQETGSWAAARSIQAEQGQPLTGPDIRPEANLKNNGNIINDFLSSVPGLDAVCTAAESAVGQVAGFAIDFVGGPVSAIVGQGIQAFAAPQLLDGLTRWLAGHPIDVNVAGADYGNYINYGARLAANDSAISAGGKKLSGTETAQLKMKQLEDNLAEQKSKSFAARVFDPLSSTSVVGSIIDKQNPHLGTSFANIFRGFANFSNIFSALSRSFSTLLSGKALAATDTSYDYGFPKYGFSVDELNNNDVKNPFENADKVVNILNGPKGDEYIARAKDCFGITLSKDGSTVQSLNSVPSYSNIPDSCTDSSTEWLRVRFFIFDTQTMDSAACYQGDGASCLAIGFNGNQGQNYE